MNNALSMLFLCISAAIGTLLPIGLAIYLNRKYKVSWKAIFIGALIFVVFQLLTRIQILNYVKTTFWFSYNLTVNPWLIYLILGFSAGLFEGVGRFVGIKYLLKDKWEWKNGIAYGLGHGGIEAILLMGIPLTATLINGIMGAFTADQAPVMFLIGGIERIFAMTFHVAASLMVLYAVRTKKYRYLFYSILIHGIIDSSIGFIKDIARIEIFVAVIAVLTLAFIIIKIRKTSSEKILFK